MADFDKINIDSASYNVKDTQAREDLAAEISAREQAYTQLQNNIDAEEGAREQADAQLQTNINAEKLAREQADARLQNNINAKLSVAPKHYSDHYRLYVDGVNGSDSNDGTSAHPFKTLDKFLNTCNQDMTDIRCYIVSPGTYTASLQVLQGITLHITATVSNVTIMFGSSSEEAFVWYNSHVNIQGPSGSYISLDCPYSYVYGDNSLFTFVRVKWLCGFWTYNGALDANNCTFYYLRLVKTMFDVYGGTTITANAGENTYKVMVDQCQGRLTGAFTLPAEEPIEQLTNSCIITGQNSYYSIEFTPSIPTNLFNNGIRNTQCVLFITAARLSRFNSCGQNGNQLTSTLIVTDNVTLPSE